MPRRSSLKSTSKRTRQHLSSAEARTLHHALWLWMLAMFLLTLAYYYNFFPASVQLYLGDPLLLFVAGFILTFLFFWGSWNRIIDLIQGRIEKK
jgi:hypothetical protein